jgi:hypothetical protein
VPTTFPLCVQNPVAEAEGRLLLLLLGLWGLWASRLNPLSGQRPMGLWTTQDAPPFQTIAKRPTFSDSGLTTFLLLR